MAIVDVIDALLSKRSYKDAWSAEKVRDYLIEQSGKQFDPLMCDASLTLLDKFVEIQQQMPDEPAQSTH
jgi:response regulator RpfG family c-di-GMP phosphodiesterase